MDLTVHNTVLLGIWWSVYGAYSSVNDFQPLTLSTKHSILDTRRGSEYVCVQIVPGNILCHHSKHLMGYIEFLDSMRMICPIFQKNCINNIFSKVRLIAFIFVNTMQYLHTLKNNIYHSNKWGPLLFFHSDINPVLDYFLVYCVDKTRILVVVAELILLLFLNIPSFNFVQTPSKSPKLPCCCSNQSFTAFLLNVRCSKWPQSSFLQLFVPNDS